MRLEPLVQCPPAIHDPAHLLGAQLLERLPTAVGSSNGQLFRMVIHDGGALPIDIRGPTWRHAIVTPRSGVGVYTTLAETGALGVEFGIPSATCSSPADRFPRVITPVSHVTSSCDAGYRCRVQLQINDNVSSP